MSLNLEPIYEKDIKIEAKGDTVFFSGDITLENFGKILTPFLVRLHKNILDIHMKKVTLDITRLNYLNSNGISEIVEWLLLIDELKVEKQYMVHIVYSSSILWQDSTVSTFVQFNPGIITKELIEG